MITEKEFIHWLRGFVAAPHHHSLTPDTWKILNEKLSEVVDSDILKMIKDPNTLTTQPSQLWTFPPYNPPSIAPFRVGDITYFNNPVEYSTTTVSSYVNSGGSLNTSRPTENGK